MKKEKSLSVLILSLAIIGGLIYGEIRCIYKACTANWNPIGKAEVIYTIGACTGAGAIIGWFNIEDK